MANLLSGLFRGRCPRCRSGALFQYPWWHVNKILAMNDSCPVCGQSYLQEPGFYYAAMYMSYAVNVALAVTCWVLFGFLFKPDSLEAFFQFVLIPVIVLVLVLLPFILRFSRTAVLYWLGNINYDPKWNKI